MPKQVASTDDPRMKNLNEVLIDLFTRNIHLVGAKRVVFADALCMLLFPFNISIGALREFHLLITNFIILYAAYHLNILMSPGEFMFAAALIHAAISPEFRSSVGELLFHFLNFISLSKLLKVAAQGYQNGNLFWHMRFHEKGLLFSLVGVYSQALPPTALHQYESFIEAYRRSKAGHEVEFDSMIKSYWAST